MSEPEKMPEPLKDLIDDYLSGLLDEAGVRQLEECLCADVEARAYFIRYARLHTDLNLEMRARQAGERALSRLEQAPQNSVPDPTPRGDLPRSRLPTWLLPTAAGLLFVLAVGGWLVASRFVLGDGGLQESAVAWLVNAQNCAWTDGVEPTGDMRAGTVLGLERGLAEVRFRCGARVVLDGPAQLELLSERSARLVRGKLTARVPPAAVGFEILSAQGKVVDLGTEFGVAVADTGATEVYVFEGRVEAHPGDGPQAGVVNLTRNQSARMTADGVQVRPVEPGDDVPKFVRAITPPPVVVPRTLLLNFNRPGAGLRDAGGEGIGLTHRLPGTGARLPDHDPNLRLDPAQAQMELTTTNSDLNTQYKLHHGEYLGVRLSDLGFTGPEDFAVTATIPDIPPLEFVGQFGLYAGADSRRNIRGGLLSVKPDEPGRYAQFLVNNKDGIDTNVHRVGLLSTGTDLRLTLRRSAGRYSLAVTNLTSGSASTLRIRHPAFLDGERDLFVGLFGANTQSEVRKTLVVKEFQVTVWTHAPSSPPNR